MRNDADVIVVGAGISGISAALEAASAGARVIVLETSSVPGGHAVKAGGFALVDTGLQRSKGLDDSPETAYADLMDWGEDADADWVRAYAENSGAEVYDWLTQLGVQFRVLLDTPEDSVPRFHFTRGTAVHAIVPMLRAAYGNENIHFMMNSRAESLIESDGRITGIRIRNTRSDLPTTLRAKSVVLATGGFQSNLEMVRANWPDGVAEPKHLLIGSGHDATGAGIELGKNAGASLSRMDRQVTFINGLPDPREPDRGLNVQNPAAIWVAADGRRFVNESANSKITEAAGLRLSPQTHWLVFDARGVKKLRVRGATWLNAKSIADEILDKASVSNKAQTIEQLAKAAGLPVGALRATIERYNADIAAGEDREFGRFGAGSSGRDPAALVEAPFYALQLLPMTRKSMGGLSIDADARVLDTSANPLEGLFAAGELTGVAGINGSHGGSGTFLGPSVFTGRVAGRSAVPDDPGRNVKAAAPDDRAEGGPRLGTTALNNVLDRPRAGFWHFEHSHATVIEKHFACERCHSETWPLAPATSTAQKLEQLDSCTQCH